MITLLTAITIIAGPTVGPDPDPGLPTIPPPLPTQIVNGDGTRMDCTPNYTQCWPSWAPHSY